MGKQSFWINSVNFVCYEELKCILIKSPMVVNWKYERGTVFANLGERAQGEPHDTIITVIYSRLEIIKFFIQ